MTHTSTEENYIKAIYHLQHLRGTVNTNSLSTEIQTRPASVTDMLKKLQVKKIVHYQPYKGFSLTETGTKTALMVIRKHRLWEYFLVHKLGFTWDEVHQVAEELEHVNSVKLIERLDDYLGNPAFDPHGDPIPDSKGKIRQINQSSLASIPEKKTVTVSAVKNQQKEMLELLKHLNIEIGTRIRVIKKFDFDGSMEIKIEKQAATIVSQLVAKNLYCTI